MYRVRQETFRVGPTGPAHHREDACLRGWGETDSGMAVESVVLCPHCGEPVDTYPDPGGGDVQRYVEDCAVCCRPLVIVARRIEGTDEYAIEVSAES